MKNINYIKIDLSYLAERISKDQVKEIKNLVLTDQLDVHLLIDLLKSENQRVVYTIFWIFREIARVAPSRISIFSEELFEALKQNQNHEGITRNAISVFQNIDSNENIESELFEFCYQNIISSKTAIAIRAFSMSVCFKIAKKYPELINELQEILKNILLYENHKQGGIQSRAIQVLAQINKLNK